MEEVFHTAISGPEEFLLWLARIAAPGDGAEVGDRVCGLLGLPLGAMVSAGVGGNVIAMIGASDGAVVGSSVARTVGAVVT